MIVAPRAAHRQPQERAARRPHHVVQLVGALVRRQHRVGRLHAVIRPAHDEPRRLLRPERIARELLADEPIERPVLIQRADHVIPIRPRRRPRLIRLKAIALREAHHVQPVPRPALAVARAGEQAVGEIADCGLRIADCIEVERLHFLRRRRQAGEVEGQPPHQRPRIRRGREREPLLRQLRGNERIDRMAAGTARHLGLAHRLEAPVRFHGIARRPVLRPHRAIVDPAAQHSHLLRGKAVALGRHHQLLVHTRDRGDETALRAFARQDHRPIRRPAHRRRAPVQPQIALLLLRPVTLHAALLQQRPHIARKVHRTPRRRRDLPSARRHRHEAVQQGGEHWEEGEPHG